MRKHGLDFTNAYRAFNEDAFVITDDREDYNESRYILLGFMRERIVVIAFTVRGDVIRVISMRKANKREQKSYLQVSVHLPQYKLSDLCDSEGL